MHDRVYNNKRDAMEDFFLAMAYADVGYIARTGKQTLHMETAWQNYVEACRQEAKHG